MTKGLSGDSPEMFLDSAPLRRERSLFLDFTGGCMFRSSFFRVFSLGLAGAVLLGGRATGQSGDLRVVLRPSIPASTVVKAGLPVDYALEVYNDGPDEVFDIQAVNHLPVEVSVLSPLDCNHSTESGSVHALTCNIQHLAAGASASFGARFVAPLSPGSLSMDAKVGTSSGIPDPDRSNNRTTLVYKVTDDADLRVSFDELSRLVEPDSAVEYRFGIQNLSFFPAFRAQFTFPLPPGFQFESADFGSLGSCEESFQRVTCAAEQIPPLAAADSAESFPITVRARSPVSARGGFFPLAASIISRTLDYNASDNQTEDFVQVYRHYTVGNVLDSGPGSLRQALEDANSECDRDRVPCRIDFAISDAVGESGWFTLRPLSPLPPLLANNLTIDGATQTRRTGNTNRFGPVIELNGESSGSGSGLEIHSRGESVVAGLAINGFPENGILVTGPPRPLTYHVADPVIRDNYVGTDPTGTRARPNGLRGIAFFTEPYSRMTIQNNLISGNVRSGLFFAAGGPYAVEGNRIGTDASGNAPLPNGGSGLYVGHGVDCVDVQDNVIAYNHDIGVASEYYQNVAIQRSSIKDNGLSGIDFGLDGATGGSSFDLAGASPVLESARFDAATGTTVIEGHFGSFAFTAVADLYANATPDGQGETWLGQASNEKGGFVLIVPGNFAGRYITATATLDYFEGFAARGSASIGCAAGHVHTTSEFSRPILVTP
jgi:uncharacterized protein DUF11/parallel beta helix pectate lyase-like protein